MNPSAAFDVVLLKKTILAEQVRCLFVRKSAPVDSDELMNGLLNVNRVGDSLVDGGHDGQEWWRKKRRKLLLKGVVRLRESDEFWNSEATNGTVCTVPGATVPHKVRVPVKTQQMQSTDWQPISLID
jgi:hypothetical protein